MTRKVSNEIIKVEPRIKPNVTVPRPKTLDILDPVNAAVAVGEFIGAPQRTGDWEINRFEITEQDLLCDYLRAHGDGKGRWTASMGEFIKLERILQHENDSGETLEVVMSNTYQEIVDHTDVLVNAWGYVLVNGLGLSCVVSGLLAKPEVKHIDVVEIDQDVIDLVGPAYEHEERVTIHQGDAYDFPWESGRRWNYVWHDIWTEISPRNLTDREKAEHGITYEMLHRRFGQRADAQASWAYKEAVRARDRRKNAEAKREALNKKWREAPDEQARVDLLVDYHVKTQFHAPGLVEPIPRDQWIEMQEALGLMDNIRKAAKSGKPPFIWVDD
jgi:hypothetical protein